MNEPILSDQLTAGANREEILSALFAHLVLQQTNTALMLLGKVPHPETGERVQDLEAAQMFIDLLEMLAVKTKGNLNKREEALLKESLTALRMAFVEAVDQRPAPPGPKPESTAGGGAAPTDTATHTPPPAEGSLSAESTERRKKFTKKY